MGENPQPLPEYTLRDSAVAIHEMFQSFMQAGFRRDEALVLTINVINQGKGSK